MSEQEEYRPLLLPANSKAAELFDEVRKVIDTFVAKHPEIEPYYVYEVQDELEYLANYLCERWRKKNPPKPFIGPPTKYQLESAKSLNEVANDMAEAFRGLSLVEKDECLLKSKINIR